MSVSGRDQALKALALFRKSGGNSELALQQVLPQLKDSREQGFCTRLYFSVLQNTTWLDYQIASFLKQPISKLQPQVLDILRLCAAQLYYMDRVPGFSAVDEAVNQCHRIAPKAAGLVNAIGRRLADPSLQKKAEGSPAQQLSTTYSHPLWFTETMLQRLGGEEACRSYLLANNAVPPIFFQCNPIKGFTAEQAIANGLKPTAFSPDCFTADNLSDSGIRQLLEQGMVYVQDPASLCAVQAAEPKPDMLVMDVCCAPGGKSFSAAMRMKNCGQILSFDYAAKKLPGVRKQAECLGITCMTVEEADGRCFIPQWEEKADLVFTDVPCSGFGVIRKKPEIRWKSKEEIEGLPVIGAAILENACRYVKTGGTLLYSTCTVLEEENEAVVKAFLQLHPEFTADEFTAAGDESHEGMLTLYPHIHGTDGFFIAKLKKH